jgi:hypothetical protein
MTGSRHSSDRASACACDGVSHSGSPSPKSPSSHPRSLSIISSNLSPPLVIQPPSPYHASLSSEPSVTVIPPSHAATPVPSKAIATRRRPGYGREGSWSTNLINQSQPLSNARDGQWNSHTDTGVQEHPWRKRQQQHTPSNSVFLHRQPPRPRSQHCLPLLLTFTLPHEPSRTTCPSPAGSTRWSVNRVRQPREANTPRPATWLHKQWRARSHHRAQPQAHPSPVQIKHSPALSQTSRHRTQCLTMAYWPRTANLFTALSRRRLLAHRKVVLYT